MNVFFYLAVIFPAFAGMLLGNFARGKKKRKVLAGMVAAAMAVLAAVFSCMNFSGLVQYFLEPGTDVLYSAFTASVFAVVGIPAVVVAPAFATSWVTARLRWLLERRKKTA